MVDESILNSYCTLVSLVEGERERERKREREIHNLTTLSL